MKYLLSIDLTTDHWIDRDMQETLKVAVSSIVTDNLDCEVLGVRLGQYNQLEASQWDTNT